MLALIKTQILPHTNFLSSLFQGPLWYERINAHKPCWEEGQDGLHAGAGDTPD